MTLSPQEASEMEKVARAATPGPWFAGPLQPEDPETGAPGDVSIGEVDLAERYGARPDYTPERFNDHYESAIAHTHGCNHDAVANARFIALFNPETILRLLAERRVMVEALTKLTLFRNPDEEIAHYAELCVKAAEEIGLELLHEDLCRLSVVFGRGTDLRDDRDRRINERLKAMIALTSSSSLRDEGGGSAQSQPCAKALTDFEREAAIRMRCFATDAPCLEGEDDKMAFFFREDVTLVLDALDRALPLLAERRAMVEALEKCLSALDDLMGDTDPFDETPALLACQAASAALTSSSSLRDEGGLTVADSSSNWTCRSCGTEFKSDGGKIVSGTCPNGEAICPSVAALEYALSWSTTERPPSSTGFAEGQADARVVISKGNES